MLILVVKKRCLMTQAIPPGFHTLTPHLTLSNASEAIEFYKKAFGAEEIRRMPAPDGKRIFHAMVKIGDSFLMLADEFPEAGCGSNSAKELSGTPVTFHLYVENVDAAFERAVNAGAKVAMPLENMVWGDRYGRVTDPFGNEWSLATHIKDVTPEEMMAAGGCAS
jgi:uncharacterized glyoxalase superfamily protein PhnB